MNEMRQQRQKLLTELLRSEGLGSQEEVQARLNAMGVSVTQATVSRDLDQLGAIKVRREGRTIYALPDDAGPLPRPGRLQAIVQEWVRSAEAVGQLVVMKTPPGSAHLVGVALDDARLEHVAGTICGDDTIFVAARSECDASKLAAWIAAGAVD